MVNSELRNGTRFIVISPKQGEIFKKNQAVDFQWETENNVLLNLYIHTNKGKVFYKAENISSNIQIHDRFIPGLYYWKVLEEDELVFVGKFLVK